MSSLRIVALLLLAGTVVAQEPASLPAVTHELTAPRVDTGQDVSFALNGYTCMLLLRLRSDGTFAEYPREHSFVGISDEGRWCQLDDGILWWTASA
jgi:hypothetical protein